MEVRTLARCLRSRSATPMVALRQQVNVLGGQSLHGRMSLRYNSSSTTPPSSPSSGRTTTSSAPRRTPTTEDFDKILNTLQINRNNTAQPSKPAASEGRWTINRSARNSRQGDGGSLEGLSLAKAAGHAAQTDNYRTPIRKVELKLGPQLGRQVHVEPERGVDLTAALRNLQINVSVNKIKQSEWLQKYHIRRGQMKKNLKMARWRRLFKYSFNHTVRKIQKLRAQGW